MNNWYNVVVTTMDPITGISYGETVMKLNARIFNQEPEELMEMLFEFTKNLAPDLREKCEIRDGKIIMEDCDGGLNVEITITAK
jgi:hypothetical protein